jgi:hypothetical protein
LAGESVSFMSVSEGGLFEEDATGSGKVWTGELEQKVQGKGCGRTVWTGGLRERARGQEHRHLDRLSKG